LFDLEKTLLIASYNTVYAGGIVEISKAIFISKDQINFGKLLE
jgi:predicted transcriptional regulator of viral defense system